MSKVKAEMRQGSLSLLTDITPFVRISVGLIFGGDELIAVPLHKSNREFDTSTVQNAPALKASGQFLSLF